MIFICEPNCSGFEHAEVNSALLYVVASAFPQEKIFFAAEKEHLKHVTSKLKQFKVLNLTGITINIPPRYSPDFVKMIPSLFQTIKIFNLASKLKSKKILFCSTTSPGLISIKILQRIYKNIRCIVMPHSILELTLRIPKRWYLIYPLLFWFRHVFLVGNSDKISYLVLGEFIKKQLQLDFPNLNTKICSIDTPYNFCPTPTFTPPKSNVRFAFLGVGTVSKGIDLFFRLAADCEKARVKSPPQFTLIGHLKDKIPAALYSNTSITISRKILSRAEFAQRISEIHYTLYLYKSYRLSTSGALFDAFSYVKPIIALRNPVFDYYFSVLGDIGYLCESYEEIKNKVLEIVNTSPHERYRTQCNNILKGREKLGYPNLARKFKYIWEET
ncbi:MAG: glycosyltransferase [Candidatus Saganbacteria bacterium]|nr:glycosyltransferase [Candidatus Saganbacteria bacterium]